MKNKRVMAVTCALAAVMLAGSSFAAFAAEPSSSTDVQSSASIKQETENKQTDKNSKTDDNTSDENEKRIRPKKSRTSYPKTSADGSTAEKNIHIKSRKPLTAEVHRTAVPISRESRKTAKNTKAARMLTEL